MKILSLLFMTLGLSLSSFLVQAEGLPVSTSPEGASIYIISPKDGAIVSEEFTVNFGLRGMGVAPAGTEKENTGHHHLLIDAETLPAEGQPMGKDVKHFGGGQTEAIITLPKGKHTLQLILGNHLHIPHNPAVVSEKITVIVE